MVVALPAHPIRRVLVVDDDPVFSDMLAQALDDEGFDVVAVAKDGHHGVELTRAASPDAVVLDMRMPGLDGIDAARRIRAFDLRVRLILLSAYDDPSLRREAAAVGAADYLVKGCRLSELVAALTAA